MALDQPKASAKVHQRVGVSAFAGGLIRKGCLSICNQSSGHFREGLQRFAYRHSTLATSEGAGTPRRSVEPVDMTAGACVGVCVCGTRHVSHCACGGR